MYSLDRSSYSRLAGTGNRRALSLLLSHYHHGQQRRQCRRRCHPSAPVGNRQRRIPAACTHRPRNVGRKHRTSQLGVAGSRAPPRTGSLPTELAAAGARRSAGLTAHTPRRGTAAKFRASDARGLSQVEVVNTALRTAHSAAYVLHRRHGDWMMRSPGAFDLLTRFNSPRINLTAQRGGCDA
jgi:hypothetical protein